MKQGRLALAGILALSLTLSPAGKAAETGALLSLKVKEMTEDPIEGPSKARAYVELGSQQIAMRKPTDCHIQSDSGKMVIDFRPRGLDGVISVSRSPVDPKRGFEAASVNDYANAAAGLLRPDASKVEVGGVRVDPYVGNGWKGMAFQYSFEARHEAKRQEIAFVNFDEANQLVISVEGSEESFDKTLALAMDFMASWYPMAEDAAVSYN